MPNKKPKKVPKPIPKRIPDLDNRLKEFNQWLVSEIKRSDKPARHLAIMGGIDPSQVTRFVQGTSQNLTWLQLAEPHIKVLSMFFVDTRSLIVWKYKIKRPFMVA